MNTNQTPVDPGGRPHPFSSISIHPDWAPRALARALRAADRLTPKGRRLAVTNLRQLFPFTLMNDLRRVGHGIVGQQLTHAGGTYLLELALAAAAVHPTKHEIARLHNSNEFDSVSAEFRAGLMFVRAGARIERPQPGHRKMICEYVATFPYGTRIAIEAKQPRLPEEDLAAEQVEDALLREVIRQLQWVSAVAPSARATFHFEKGIMSLWANDTVDEPRLMNSVEVIVGRIRDAILESTFGTVSLGQFGSFTLCSDLTLGSLQFDAFGYGWDAKQRSQALTRNLLNKAIRQIQTTSVPGVIVLDVQRAPLSRNSTPFLHRWAQRKPDLAAIFVMDRHVISDRMYADLDVIPGPAFDSTLPALSSLFEVCDQDHVHYNPMSRLVAPCPCTWLTRAS